MQGVQPRLVRQQHPQQGQHLCRTWRGGNRTEGRGLHIRIQRKSKKAHHHSTQQVFQPAGYGPENKREAEHHQGEGKQGTSLRRRNAGLELRGGPPANPVRQDTRRRQTQGTEVRRIPLVPQE